VVTSEQTDSWVEEEEEEEEESYPIEYRITSTPNDFNVKTIFDFMKSGIVGIPGFQRNYVWDIKKASKLIESLIMNLPVPQIFLYEKAKNSFLVIDGQQRLMTIYYFLKKRFPKAEKRVEIRRIFDEQGIIPEEIMSSDEYFIDFTLKLSERLIDRKNRLEGLNYDTLDEADRTTLELRAIRCVIVRPFDKDDDSSMYEIFYRLNTGGVNLTPQEIRACIYYSDFYEMLSRINLDPKWRRLTKAEPDIRMRDMESLLRGFAMLVSGEGYQPPMVRFLNGFSHESKEFSQKKIDYLEKLFNSFLDNCEELPPKAFYARTNRFSISMYEAIFAAVCEEAFTNNSLDIKPLSAESLEQLKTDPDFVKASQSQTTSKENVELRLRKAKEILLE
jgi:hypothetical protein